MINLIDLEKKVNSELTTKINKSEIKHNQIYIEINKENLIDQNDIIPTGPTISSNDGDNAQNRTYQDLLKNKTDESNFEQLVNSEIYKVSLNGEIQKWLEMDMYTNISPSPDGNFVIVSSIKRPFSYIVTYGRFPRSISVHDDDGNLKYCNHADSEKNNRFSSHIYTGIDL